MSSPDVSVITPARNAARYLPDAIESILAQTMGNLELILIDDGSTDDTLGIIKHYATIDSRVLYVIQANSGPAAARNVGIRMMRGRWIAILDADDSALPDRLARQVAYMQRTPDVVLLGSGCVEIDAVGTRVKQHHYPRRHARLVQNMERHMKFPPHSSCMYDVEAVRRLGGFNSRFTHSQDIDLWLRLSEIGRVACLPQPLIRLRKHDSSISHDRRGEAQRVMGMAARVCHFLRLRGSDDPAQVDITVWDSFLTWLTQKMKAARLFEMGAEWARIRQQFYLDRHMRTPTERLRLMKNVAVSAHGLPVLYHRFFGSNLASRFAREWEDMLAANTELSNVSSA